MSEGCDCRGMNEKPGCDHGAARPVGPDAQARLKQAESDYRAVERARTDLTEPAPVPAGPTDAQGELREALREPLALWMEAQGRPRRYTEPARAWLPVADAFLDEVLLPTVRDALAAQETVGEAERRGYERGKRETAEFLLRVAEGARQRAGDS